MMCKLIPIFIKPYIIPNEFEGQFPKGNLPMHQCVGYTDFAFKQFFESAKTISLKYKNVYFLIIGDRLSSDHNESVYENLLETKKSIKDNLIFLSI